MLVSLKGDPINFYKKIARSILLTPAMYVNIITQAIMSFENVKWLIR